ncbi:MFS transporter [Mesorhizobium sp. M0959]
MQHKNPHPSFPTTLAPLRNQVFRSIWISTQISSLGLTLPL